MISKLLILSFSVLNSSVNAFLQVQPTTSASKFSLRDGMSPPGSDDDMSIALPFLKRPSNLDGSLAGDFGFDPLGFSGSDKDTLIFMREAEIKHGRLAMLAVVGWPIAELADKTIATVLGLPDALTKSGESPSILNGGLEKVSE